MLRGGVGEGGTEGGTETDRNGDERTHLETETAVARVAGHLQPKTKSKSGAISSTIQTPPRHRSLDGERKKVELRS